ncbi:hypothetical protein [Conexibacter arvalis]|uniref:Uncharacterized protein n=1 Tax=Conexibacter arvalis TaxID=912552 RepID=A0A840IFA0_9ACTN|nr:hypothetical protein [Conexibacter arvalis]MBB4662873.1 hypothetical protein [Conexibacter arvalis]
MLDPVQTALAAARDLLPTLLSQAPALALLAQRLPQCAKKVVPFRWQHERNMTAPPHGRDAICGVVLLGVISLVHALRIVGMDCAVTAAGLRI